MPKILNTHAQEKSVYVINCSFVDEDGDAVLPDSVNWTLTTESGTVINSRLSVPATPATSLDIVLYGDDLAIQSGETAAEVNRKVLLECVYDSDLGDNLPLKESVQFVLDNLTYVS